MRRRAGERTGEKPGGQAGGARQTSACRDCLRRSWLLGELSGRLEYRGRNLGRLLDLLALSDEELMQAESDAERDGLTARWREFDAGQMRQARGVGTICRHSCHYPGALIPATEEPVKRRAVDPSPMPADAVTRLAPRALHVTGAVGRLGELLAGPAVAIVGSRRATDYGMETARSLARGLAASGVTVVSGLADGIPAAAHAGALDVEGPTVTVMPGGVDVCAPARMRELYEGVRTRGCAVSELPCGIRPRRWCFLARTRTVAWMASAVVVVEAGETAVELASANIARALGRPVAAVPGRVSSPASQGTHALLMQGARLVRDAQDALDVLYGAGMRQVSLPSPDLNHHAVATLERVGAGEDTIGMLTAGQTDPAQTLLALAELELTGLLARGDGGRYVPCGRGPAR